MTKRRVHAEPRRPWTAKELHLVRSFYPHIATKEIADELGREVHCVYRQAKNMGLRKTDEYLATPEACRLRRGDNVGAAFRYPKGHVPANKGLRRPGYAAGRMAETQWKKGQQGHNWKPIGSKRLVDGYVYRKISDIRCVPWTRNWRAEHILIWEKRTGKTLDIRTHCLCFRDRNRLNTKFSNLELITRKELRCRNSIHHLPEDIKEVLHLKAAINSRITRARKRQHRAEQDNHRSA
jgi:hypothetical protein